MLTGMTVLIALVSVLLIGVILIQNPKGGGLDSTFGSAGNQMFGAAKSADFIEKLTWYLFIALIVLSILTTLMVGTGGSEVPLITE
jgi:preprotein translocase subunit SecG